MTTKSQFSTWANLIGELGSLLFVSVAIALIWELSGKKSFSEEIYSKLDVAISLQESGLKEIVFHMEEINWDELFRSTREIDLFFAYNIQWRSINDVRLIDFVSRPGTKIRIVLPDVTDSEMLKNMAGKFNKNQNVVETRVQEAIDDFTELAETAQKNKSLVEIWTHNTPFQYSLYRFDNIYIYSPYKQQKGKIDIPHLIFSKSGKLSNFFDADLQFITNPHNSKLINSV